MPLQVIVKPKEKFCQQELASAAIYTLEQKPNLDLEQIAASLSNQVTDDVLVFEPETQADLKALDNDFEWLIEVRKLPGVTDNLGKTAQEILEESQNAKQEITVYSSKLFFLKEKLSREQVEKKAADLHNALIEKTVIKTKEEFFQDQGMGINLPKVVLNLDVQNAVQEVDLLNASQEELILIGQKGISADGSTGVNAARRGPLALDLEQMLGIQEYFKRQGRNPRDIELEAIAQTWSEHCKHTIFASPIDEIKKGLYKEHIKAATQKVRELKAEKDNCVSVFTDNAGGIEFDENFIVSHKAETHNSPSALDPFGGSITGILGVNRDQIGFGMGAKPVANTYNFCFADPKNTKALYKGKNFTQKMLSPKRIMEGVIEGVNFGGNQSGIPTVLGSQTFHEGYRGKPLVFVGTIGLLPKQVNSKPGHTKAAQPGDLIVVVGGRVGKDGIHGATFSSVVMDENSPATAVQIGDSFTQKKVSDAIVKEARDKNLYSSITDNGAGGISCSVAEMAKECGGCEVELEKVPLKYPGLEPWEIWISESQERITLAVPPEKWQEFFELMQSRGVEATAIGKFTDSGNCVVNYQGKTIMDLEQEFLHDGLPEKHLKTKEAKEFKPNPSLEKAANFKDYFLSAKLEGVVCDLLSRNNIASYDFISEQYDHEVQGGSVLKPLQGKGMVNALATAFKPVLNSPKAVVLSEGINPNYSHFDTYHMTAAAIDSAIRASVAVGAKLDEIALLDNFCWYSGNEPESLWKLKRSTQACYDYATAYRTPFISGKDSMFNDFKGFDENGKEIKISIPPTLLISSMAVMADANKAVSMDVKFAGDLLYVIGQTHDELAGSELASMLETTENLRVPEVDTKTNIANYVLMHQAIEQGLFASSASVAKGGLIACLAKKAIAGDLGMELDLQKLKGSYKDLKSALFSESQGRIVVSVAAENQEKFESLFAEVLNEQVSLIGKVSANKKITDPEFLDLDLAAAKEAYKKTFKGL